MSTLPSVQELRARKDVIRQAGRILLGSALATVIGGVFYFRQAGVAQPEFPLLGFLVGMLWRSLILKKKFISLGSWGIILFYTPIGVLAPLFSGGGAYKQMGLLLRVADALLVAGSFYAALFAVIYLSLPALLAGFDSAIQQAEHNARLNEPSADAAG